MTHHHEDKHGKLIECYHECRSQLKSLSFWVLLTVSFPLEHFIWEKMPGLSWITHNLLGL